jgi:hypothetical protein
LKNAPAQKDPIGSVRTDQIVKSLCDVIGFELPGGVVGRKLAGGYAPSGGQGWAARESFPTITVVGAVASKGVLSGIAGNPHVPHLRRGQGMDQLALTKEAGTDAGTDGEVQQPLGTLSGPIVILPQRSGEYIGRERHRETQCLL